GGSGGFGLGQAQEWGLEWNVFFAATPSTMPAVEATETFPNKALFPQSNRIDTAAHRPTGLGLTVAGRQTQNDLRAHGLSHASAPSSGSTLQHFSLRRRNYDTFRHPLFLQQQPINNQCNSALGIARDDQKARRKALLRNYDFFDAPVVGILCMPESLGVADAVSVGIYLQTLMLSLTARGLGSCAQVALAGYPEVLRSELKIPSELLLISALAI